jgi:hypothetical protein
VVQRRFGLTDADITRTLIDSSTVFASGIQNVSGEWMRFCRSASSRIWLRSPPGALQAVSNTVPHDPSLHRQAVLNGSVNHQLIKAPRSFCKNTFILWKRARTFRVQLCGPDAGPLSFVLRFCARGIIEASFWDGRYVLSPALYRAA